MAPHIIFGAGGIGSTENSFTFTFDTVETIDALFSSLKSLGITELDSAAAYPPGNPWNTEYLLGKTNTVQKGFTIDSKVEVRHPEPTLTEEGIENSIDKTLSLIGADKVRILYAHIPDNHTPLEITAAAFDKQYRLGKFEKLGLSNYTADDLAQYFAICEEKGYVKPSVYQGCYNAIFRGPEKDLIPLLRKHNCAFYAFSPLAGGFLTGKVTFTAENDSNSLERTRWRGESAHLFYQKNFDQPSMHEAVRKLKKACDAASPPISMQEASLRWIVQHSALGDGDAIIVGAKRLDQLESNVLDSRKGALDKELIEAFDEVWNEVAAAK